jgi:7,8-dihydropterin-6-yl-methyl-4-(beta-D-ribofuranosyl)aminobenzene 5'-phosphate synthase
VSRAKDILQDDILFVMGGFHLGDTPRSDIQDIVSRFRELGVVYAGPCHCTGSTAQELFKEEYGQYYVEIGVGRIIYVKELE